MIPSFPMSKYENADRNISMGVEGMGGDKYE